jgi:acetyltransferase-like isoleucine patch superfamily enzyme
MKLFIKYLIWRFWRRKSGIASTAVVSLNCQIGNGVRILRDSKIGDSTFSHFSYVGERSQIERSDIGSFCSIGPEVMIGMGAHPINFVSTYPGFYTGKSSGAVYFGTRHDVDEFRRVKVGADVWIGARAIILGGISVGTGSIIAAGAVVTRDVPPYSIVGGVPARHIKYRFPDDVRSRLLETQWWSFDRDRLVSLAPVFNDVNHFLSKIEVGNV